jgi:hypothetical protein
MKNCDVLNLRLLWDIDFCDPHPARTHVLGLREGDPHGLPFEIAT